MFGDVGYTQLISNRHKGTTVNVIEIEAKDLQVGDRVITYGDAAWSQQPDVARVDLTTERDLKSHNYEVNVTDVRIVYTTRDKHAGRHFYLRLQPSMPMEVVRN